LTAILTHERRLGVSGHTRAVGAIENLEAALTLLICTVVPRRHAEQARVVL